MLNLDVRNLMIENSTRMDFNKKKFQLTFSKKGKKLNHLLYIQKWLVFYIFPYIFFF